MSRLLTFWSEHWAELGPGDALMLVVVGSGLTWSGLQMEVAA